MMTPLHVACGLGSPQSKILATPCGGGYILILIFQTFSAIRCVLDSGIKHFLTERVLLISLFIICNDNILPNLLSACLAR